MIRTVAEDSCVQNGALRHTLRTDSPYRVDICAWRWVVVIALCRIIGEADMSELIGRGEPKGIDIDGGSPSENLANRMPSLAVFADVHKCVFNKASYLEDVEIGLRRIAARESIVYEPKKDEPTTAKRNGSAWTRSAEIGNA